MRRILIALGLLMVAEGAVAGEVKVAVASNFTVTAERLAAAFTARTGDEAVLSFGASGALYTQIAQGAPFEVLLSADGARPRMAIENGFAVGGTRQTYAIGALVLYAPGLDLTSGFGVLKADAFAHLAVADPTTSPSGAAADFALAALGLKGPLADRLVDLAGLWLPAQTVYLDNRPMNGRPGFWVLTPLRLSGTDKLVLVQRGWMARDFVDRTRLTPIQTQTTEVRIQGRMAPGPAKLYAFKGADTGLIRQNLDIQAYAEEIRQPLIPVLVLQTGAASEGLQRDWAAPNNGVDKHHGYAVQWFALCALVLGLYAWFQGIVPLRRRAKSP